METISLYELYLKYPSVQTDTRKLKKDDIFFALKGPSFNGNAFAAQALGKGASFAVIDEVEYATDDRCILVPDVQAALQDLARHHRLQFDIPFIAITGSNGKTTTKELVTAVLRQKYTTYATEGNLNNHIGVPLTLLSIKKDAEMAVIEMGANHQLEIAGYCKVALPTHGLITNCGKAHIEGFGGEEGVRNAKGELYDHIRNYDGVIFRNVDLPYLEDMAKGIENQITYGSANAKYIGRPLADGTLLKTAILSSGHETTISSNLIGAYNFPNIMAAVAVGLEFGLDIDQVKQAVQDYNPDNSRSQFVTQGSNRIILDAYNANPSSMQAAISNFAASELPHKRLWLGGMKEMGPAEVSEHTDLVSYIDRYSWEQVILVGKEFEGLNGKHLWFETSSEAASWLKDHLPENASILIKGSRGSRMELMFEALKGKA